MATAIMTKVRMLHGVPLDPTYRDTLYWNNLSSQTAYFESKSKYGFDYLTYQRQQSKIRLPYSADLVYDCNYVMYQNESYSDKWFYGFITSIEYVNDNACDVHFEIDVLQTWFFEFSLQYCFVEREHSITDNPGDNLVPESFDLGDYVYDTPLIPSGNTSKCIVVCSTFNNDLELSDADGVLTNGVYSGLAYNVYELGETPSSITDAIVQVNAFLEDAVTNNKAEGIVSIFMCPFSLTINSDDRLSPTQANFNLPTRINLISGYLPRNKKLLTYPYNFIYVTNNQGNSANYHYEYFTNPEQPTATISGSLTCNPEMILWPNNYKGVADNSNEMITVSGFPQCAYNIDSFKAWLAQTAASLPSIALSTASSIGSTTIAGAKMGAIAGGPVGAAAGAALGAGAGVGSAINNIAQIVAKGYETSTRPPQAAGNAASGTAFACNLNTFYAYRTQIRAEFARIIDNFFDMFGYATNRVKIPNRSSRPHWNYVKTQKCMISGNLPAEAIAKIREIHDAGITYWKNPSEVGDYSLNNSPS